MAAGGSRGPVPRGDGGERLGGGNPEIEEINSAEIIIAKHRNGPTGAIRLKFDPSRASFDALDKYHTPPTTV